MNKTVFISLVAGILLTATVATMGTLNLAIVSAEKCGNGTPCDGWGQSTKKAATDDGKAVGEHSSNPDPGDDDHDTPREGLGNFAEDLTGNKNPSDLGDIVDGNLP
jgi:hypothetical protein